MEIFFIVVTIVIILLVVAGKSRESRDVTDMSLEELKRYRDQHIVRSQLCITAGKHEEYKKYRKRIDEFSTEISRRLTGTSSGINEFKSMMDLHLKLVQRLVDKVGYTEEKANEIILNKFEICKKKFLLQGVSEDEATDKATQEIYKTVKEPQKDELRAATKVAKREPEIADSVVRKTSAENLSNHDKKAVKSNGDCVFRIGGGDALPAYLYGINATKYSLEESEKAIEEIIGSNESNVQQEISVNRGQVQLHLMALQAAAFYVCANMISSSNHDVLTDVARGIANGFAAIMGEYHSDNLYDIFKDYGHSLAKELKRNDDDNFMDMGATAQLVGKNISGQCNIDTILADNPIEKLRIEEIVRRNGIGLLLMLLADRGVTYNE